MGVKHYKLIASVVMLVGLLGLPLVPRAKVTEVTPTELGKIEENAYVENRCPATFEMDPLYGSKLYVRTTLKSVYRLPEKDLDWWSHYIAASSKRWNVPEDYLIVVIAIESEFNANVKTSNGNVGPSQIHASTWKTLMKKRFGLNIHNPSDNIIASGYILKDYKDFCGSWNCALISYNVGPGAYKRGENKQKQKDYSAKVSRHFALIKNKRG